MDFVKGDFTLHNNRFLFFLAITLNKCSVVVEPERQIQRQPLYCAVWKQPERTCCARFVICVGCNVTELLLLFFF